MSWEEIEAFFAGLCWLAVGGGGAAIIFVVGRALTADEGKEKKEKRM